MKVNSNMILNSIVKEALLILAKKNTLGYPFSACIYYKGEYFYEVNKVLDKYDPTSHAEINCIRMVCDKFKTIDLSGAILFSSGEPCPMCLSAIAWAGIKEVYFINKFNVANDQGYHFDGDSRKLNDFLKLGINIQEMVKRG